MSFSSAQGGVAVMSGNVGRAVRGTAASGIAEGGFSVGDAADNHAVMQEGEHHGKQRGFLSAVQGGGAGEDGGGFADAMLPKRVGLPSARAAQVLRSSAVA